MWGGGLIGRVKVDGVRVARSTAGRCVCYYANRRLKNNGATVPVRRAGFRPTVTDYRVRRPDFVNISILVYATLSSVFDGSDDSILGIALLPSGLHDDIRALAARFVFIFCLRSRHVFFFFGFHRFSPGSPNSDDFAGITPEI